MVIASKDYNIIIGDSALKALPAFIKKQKYTRVYILCDSNTLQHCLPQLVISCPLLADAEIIEIESGESSKDLEVVASILQTLVEQQADRNTLLINLGGGVVSDLGGFCASIYKRGIDFINVPTSMLAMADASVGGKTGIDFAGIKNVVGTFAQPAAVFIYPAFLKTLPERQMKNGLAEVFKIALVSDRKFWEILTKQTHFREPASIIARSIKIKNEIVMKDPHDHDVRKILNFGHTIGHALEALSLATDADLLHGEAVLAGMIIESHLAFQKKLITLQDLTRITSVLSSKFKLIAAIQFPVEAIAAAMANDKKNSGKQYKFSLLNGIGSCVYDLGANDRQIKNAVQYYNTRQS